MPACTLLPQDSSSKNKASGGGAKSARATRGSSRANTPMDDADESYLADGEGGAGGLSAEDVAADRWGYHCLVCGGSGEMLCCEVR